MNIKQDDETDTKLCSKCGEEFEPEELTCVDSGVTTDECTLHDVCEEAYCEEHWEDE